MNFPERLESLRKGITQRDFAKLIGVPLTSYTNWIAGISTPKMEYIILICTKLGISSDWLLGLSEENEKIESENKKKLEGLKSAILSILENY